MGRSILFLVPGLILAMTGCAGMDDGMNSTIQPLTPQEIRNQISALNIENAALRKDLDDIRMRYVQTSDRLSTLEREYERIDRRNTELEARVAELQDIERIVKYQRRYSGRGGENGGTPAAAAMDHGEAARHRDADAAPLDVKVKVLSGDGRIESALKMADLLRGLGFHVESMAFAPRSNFLAHTVYFAHGFEDQGRSIVDHLGEGVIMKPLNWPSGFHLIIVTGKGF
jgi:hypothetical protein